MNIRVAINGFGRIGRSVFRILCDHPTIEVVCINDIFKNEALAYLLKYDTIMGTLKQDVTHDDHALYVGGKKILMTSVRNPAEAKWKELGIDAPSIADAYRSIYGKDAAGAAWEAEKALIGGYSLTRMMAVAPKTPPALIAELRQAFQAMSKDQAFLAEWTKSQGSPPRLVPGEEAGNIASSILKAPKEAVNILKKLSAP